LARLFNEASGQKAPSKKHGLFISRPLGREYMREVGQPFQVKLFTFLICT
jgi:hypothetical protein